MSPLVNIAVDAMGGDNAPIDAVRGCVDALDESELAGRTGFGITLVGREYAIHSILNQLSPRADYLKTGRLNVRHADEIIMTGESPTAAIKEKKKSSLVVALRLIKEGAAQAAVSAGNTGALLTGGLLLVGRLKGVIRPALGVLVPTYAGPKSRIFSLIIDAGANTDAKPAYLEQFARMGSAYMESLFQMKKPRVGLVNIGAEAEKGNALVKEVYDILKASDLNFTGNLEARELALNGADVAVCDGFVGNILLKFMEGLSKGLFSIIKDELRSTPLSMAGALLSKGAFGKVKQRFDATEVGGAPFLGLNGLLVKAHGNSNAKAYKNAVWKAVTYVETGAQDKLRDYFGSIEAVKD